MKTYAITLTLFWKSPSEQDAINECHYMFVNFENSIDSPGYQGYQDMRVREIPSKPGTSA